MYALRVGAGSKSTCYHCLVLTSHYFPFLFFNFHIPMLNTSHSHASDLHRKFRFVFLKSQTLHVFNAERDLSYPVPSVFLGLTLELVIQGDNRLLQHRDIGKLSFHEKKFTAMSPSPPKKQDKCKQTFSCPVTPFWFRRNLSRSLGVSHLSYTDWYKRLLDEYLQKWQPEVSFSLQRPSTMLEFPIVYLPIDKKCSYVSLWIIWIKLLWCFSWSPSRLCTLRNTFTSFSWLIFVSLLWDNFRRPQGNYFLPQESNAVWISPRSESFQMPTAEMGIVS